MNTASQQQNQQKNPRKISLDIIRCVAILFVILNHSVESYYNLEEYDYATAVNSFEASGIMFLFLAIYSRVCESGREKKKTL